MPNVCRNYSLAKKRNAEDQPAHLEMCNEDECLISWKVHEKLMKPPITFLVLKYNSKHAGQDACECKVGC